MKHRRAAQGYNRETTYRACVVCQEDHRRTDGCCSDYCAMRHAGVEDLTLEIENNPAFQVANV